MASKRMDRLLSLPKNWRVVKKTKKNGEFYYHCQKKSFFFGLFWTNDVRLLKSDRFNGIYGMGFLSDKWYKIDTLQEHIIKRITEHATSYANKCGEEIHSTKIINLIVSLKINDD